jgi:hypothetical protein
MILKKILTALLLILASFGVKAQMLNQQFTAPAGSPKTCGFDALHEQKLATDTAYARKMQGFNQMVAQSGGATTKASNTTYRIPVVVHVMETGGSLTAISDQQIKDAIRSVNERFRKVLGGPGDGNGVDVEIEFALAVQDPSGNCTDGILRVDMSTYSDYMSDGVRLISTTGITDAALKAVSYWNSSDYYNIWLVSEIDNNNGGSGIQGYAYLAGAHGQTYDGMVMLSNGFKNTSSTTATHELGHALNLYHTFEGDNNGNSCPTNNNCALDGDFCCDTPPHIRTAFNCPAGQANACDAGTNTDDYIHNYMDYSSDACQDEFTADQSIRAKAALDNQRSSFLATNGNVSLIPPTVATVDFSASASFVCSGTDIQFYDLSSCIPNTFLDTTYWNNITFSWTFDNGTNTFTSSLQNPLMSLPTGSYDVTLSVTNSSGTATLTKFGYVVSGNSPGAACTPSSNNVGNFAQTVNEVSFNTISNATSSITNVAYSDFSCTNNTIVTEGNTYQMDISIRAGGSAQETVQAYIDYNNDGVFQVGEMVLSGSTPASSTNIITANITIPAGAVQGTLLRMRVYGEAGTLSSNEIDCGSSSFVGDVEDYGIYIQSTSPLPIELLFFDAKLVEDNIVELQWSTSSETNNDFFNIEKSRDGNQWELLEKINGAGHSNHKIDYLTFDDNPFTGLSYYRLKQTDFNGDYEYSEIRSVSTNGVLEEIEIYPNPTEEKVTIKGSAYELSSIRIMNSLGQQIDLHKVKWLNNNSSVVIDFTDLARGIYYVQTKTLVNKVIKQ